MKQEIKNILSKYISDKNKSSNQEEINNILGGSKHEKDVKDFMIHNWTDVLKEDQDINKDLNPVLHKVHHELRVNEFLNKSRIKYKLVKWYSYAAAVLLLPLLVSSLVYFFVDKQNDEMIASQFSTITIESHNGQSLNFNLPDGTVGVLNAGSKITYNLPFNNNRKLALTGCAFFEVKHDTEHPFRVNTRNVDIKVLGTKFGVESYNDDDFTNVVLEEGKVMCEIPSQGKKVIMKPNEKLIVEDDKILLSKANSSDLIGWKDGLLVFRNEEMPLVIKKLMRWYNVDITLEDVDLKKYSFKATFDDEPIDEVLKLLARTSPIRYEVEKRKMDAKGKYTRKKIKIYKRIK